MAIMTFDTGCRAILGTYFNNSRPVDANLKLKLYCNNHTPNSSDTNANFVIAVGGGYADKTLNVGSWVINSNNDPSDAVYANQVFTFTGPLTTNTTIYGWIVNDANNVSIYGDLLRDNTQSVISFTPTNNGDMLTIPCQYQASHGTPIV